MDKSTYFLGCPVFGQLLNLIPHEIVSNLVRELGTDKYCKTFRTKDHLVTMLYACLYRCDSIRELTTGLAAHTSKLKHLGLLAAPKRSTISDANKNRDALFFEHLFHKLVQYFVSNLSDSSRKNLEPWMKRLSILDSTTVKLFTDVMKGAGDKPSNGKAKGGAKVHTLLDAKHDLPKLVRVTEGKDSDKIMLKYISLPPNSIITFDKGYRDYKVWDKFTEQQITYVTRMHGNETYEAICSNILSKQCSEAGIIADKKIRLGSGINKNVIQDARLVQYKDPTSGKELEFVTNNFELTPTQITLIYKQRWQIEVFFKRLKRHSPLKYFLGETDNAIKIQIWCSLILDLLLQVVKLQAKTSWAFTIINSIFRHLAMTYFNIIKYLNNPKIKTKIPDKVRTLFDTT